MIVNSVNTYRAFTNKANTTANALPQAYTSPAFTGNERPTVPRKSMFGSLKALVLGGALLAAPACGTENPTSNAKQKMTTDAATLINTMSTPEIDALKPTTAIDTAPNNNITVADILRDDLKAAGILPTNATKLPNVMEYDSPSYISPLGYTNVARDNGYIYHFVEKIDTNNSDPSKVIFNCVETIKNADAASTPYNYITEYTSNLDGTLTKSIKFTSDGNVLEFYNCKMTQRNNYLVLDNFASTLFNTTGKTDASFNDTQFALKKIGSGEIGFFENGDLTTPIDSYKNWINDGVLATRLRKGTEALAERFGKVAHDLKTGELSVPIGKGKVAVIADLAKKAVKKARV